MRVLVTGGGGFVGRHLLRELSGSGSAITATVLEDPPTFVPDDRLSAVDWLSMDLDSPASIREVLDVSEPDLIYHLAGQASVGQSFDHPMLTWQVNATGTLRLMEALGERGKTGRKLLLVSSAEVYGEVPDESQPIPEQQPLRPATPYGASKAAAEIAVSTMGAVEGVATVVARSFNHVGPGQDERFVLPSIARQLTRIRRGERDPVVRVGNLEVERDFLDVRDVVRGYVHLATKGEIRAAYNVCSGIGRTLLSVVERLIELSGTGARLEIDAERVRAVDIPKLVGDPSRLQALGWSSRIALDDTLTDLLAEAEAGG